MVKEGIKGMLTIIVNNDDMAILQATGTPINKSVKKLKTKTSIGKYSIITVCIKYL